MKTYKVLASATYGLAAIIQAETDEELQEKAEIILYDTCLRPMENGKERFEMCEETDVIDSREIISIEEVSSEEAERTLNGMLYKKQSKQVGTG